MKSIFQLRTKHAPSPLSVETVKSSPSEQFLVWLQEARRARIKEENAMVVSTITATGHPSARVLLLKGVEKDKFIFFTNYQSQKAHDLAHQPACALTFFWAKLERQVRIEGVVEKITEKESDLYFSTRPRGSQIGAWASNQSSEIEDRSVLDKAWQKIATQYDNQPIPKPPHWGGYALNPSRVEFWQGQANRLHDRIVYQQINGRWQIARLSP